MNKVIPSKKELIELYINQKLPIHSISKILNMSVGKIFKYIKLYEIETRKNQFNFKGHKHKKESLEKMSKKQKGKIISDETKEKMSKTRLCLTKGGIGHKKTRIDGYKVIYFPDHPKSNKDGYIMEHILVMECSIGRHLQEDEVVHHKNHIRDDNRIDNLQLMTFKEHASMHMKERYENKKERNDDLSIR